MNWIAIWGTFKLAGLTALILLVVGIPIAYWVSFSAGDGSRGRVGGGTAFSAAADRARLLHPHRDRSTQSVRPVLYRELVEYPLPFTFEGLLLASVLYSLPFAVQPFSAAFDQVDRRLIETSWTLGVSKFKKFVKLIAPLSVAGLITGFVLSFAHTLGEFDVVLMVGGNIEGSTRTVSIDHL